jgi:threonyl-tRNA synthetase
VQLDFHQPEAFDLKYTDNQGKEQRPVMIHRAIFGSFERFIGILTEHYAGAFPTWLAPTQAVVMPITDLQADYAQKVTAQLAEAGIRVELDNRSESLQARIRDAELLKTPFILVAGGREAEAGTISIRKRGEKDQKVSRVDEFCSNLKEEISSKK